MLLEESTSLRFGGRRPPVLLRPSLSDFSQALGFFGLNSEAGAAKVSKRRRQALSRAPCSFLLLSLSFLSDDFRCCGSRKPKEPWTSPQDALGHPLLLRRGSNN